ADKGTIFLDEIGELPPSIQAKLLRVLEEHEFEPLGGIKTVKIDVRIITATNRDLQQAIKQGKFRDWYYQHPVHGVRNGNYYLACWRFNDSGKKGCNKIYYQQTKGEYDFANNTFYNWCIATHIVRNSVVHKYAII
ncbi:unnamed protein product, partial [marine sediment metagenome]